MKWKEWFQSESRELASTTISGQFSEGSSFAGVLDMSGNAWEWTSSDFSETEKVLRGGSWDSNELIVRCAYRGNSIPDGFVNYIGFRVLFPSS
jgi:formylglycine-generating enzyme required for sulfatase activity